MSLEIFGNCRGQYALGPFSMAFLGDRSNCFIKAVDYSWQHHLHENGYHSLYTGILPLFSSVVQILFMGIFSFFILVYLCVAALKNCTQRQNGKEKVKLLDRCFLKSCKVRIFFEICISFQ